MHVAAGQLPPDPHKTFQDAMQARQTPEVEEQAAVPAVPVETPSQPLTSDVQAGSPAAKRAQKIAALEGDAGLGLPDQTPPVQAREDVAVLDDRPRAVDPTAVVVDQPPTAGLNPRWNPPKQQP